MIITNCKGRRIKRTFGQKLNGPKLTQVVISRAELRDVLTCTKVGEWFMFEVVNRFGDSAKISVVSSEQLERKQAKLPNGTWTRGPKKKLPS